MGAASFKSLYQKRPAQEHATAHRCVAGRSRYSTKTLYVSDQFPYGQQTGNDQAHYGKHLKLC